MNLYRVTAEVLGTSQLIVKAKSPNQAADIARDVIEESYLDHDPVQEVMVEELVQPEKNKAGYCYLNLRSGTYHKPRR